jgi:hypothetical protein
LLFGFGAWSIWDILLTYEISFKCHNCNLNYEEIFSQESEECLDLSMDRAKHVCIGIIGSDFTPSSLPICRRAGGSELPAIWGTWLAGIRYGQWF